MWALAQGEQNISNERNTTEISWVLWNLKKYQRKKSGKKIIGHTNRYAITILLVGITTKTSNESKSGAELLGTIIVLKYSLY